MEKCVDYKYYKYDKLIGNIEIILKKDIDENMVLIYKLISSNMIDELEILMDRNKFFRPIEIKRSTRGQLNNNRIKIKIDELGRMYNSSSKYFVWFKEPFYMYEQIMFMYHIIMSSKIKGKLCNIDEINTFTLPDYNFRKNRLVMLDEVTFQFENFNIGKIKFDTNDNLLNEYYNKISNIKIIRK